MKDQIDQCTGCGLRGYTLTDKERGLCHLCIDRETKRNEMAASLKEIWARFEQELPVRWTNCDFAKAYVGNAIIAAIQEYDPGWRPTA